MSVFVYILMFMHKLLDDLHEIGEGKPSHFEVQLSSAGTLA